MSDKIRYCEYCWIYVTHPEIEKPCFNKIELASVSCYTTNSRLTTSKTKKEMISMRLNKMIEKILRS